MEAGGLMADLMTGLKAAEESPAQPDLVMVPARDLQQGAAALNRRWRKAFRREAGMKDALRLAADRMYAASEATMAAPDRVLVNFSLIRESTYGVSPSEPGFHRLMLPGSEIETTREDVPGTPGDA